MTVELEKLIAVLKEAEAEEEESAAKYRKIAQKQKDPEIAERYKTFAKTHGAAATAYNCAQIIAEEIAEYDMVSKLKESIE